MNGLTTVDAYSRSHYCSKVDNFLKFEGGHVATTDVVKSIPKIADNNVYSPLAYSDIREIISSSDLIQLFVGIPQIRRAGLLDLQRRVEESPLRQGQFQDPTKRL